MQTDGLNREISRIFEEITTEKINNSQNKLIALNLYGFAKALIKAKLETDGDLYASKGREIQNDS